MVGRNLLRKSSFGTDSDNSFDSMGSNKKEKQEEKEHIAKKITEDLIPEDCWIN